MTPKDLEKILQEVLMGTVEDDEYHWATKDFVQYIDTYEEAQMMTHDVGLVIHCLDGSEFRLSIHQAR